MSPIANVLENGPRADIFRGHIWTSRAFTEVAQKPILAPICGGAIYTDDFDHAIKSLRQGNALVVPGMRGIGRGRAEILANVARVHARGAVVMDAASFRLSIHKRHLAAMLDEAGIALTNERRGPRKRSRKDPRMPWDQVAALYFDARLSNDELEQAVAVNGFAPMSYHTMWRHFQKPRGAPVGRPSAGRRAMRAATIQ